jgi:ATP-binding cassette subfamily G (WHITE) protein 2
MDRDKLPFSYLAGYVMQDDALLGTIFNRISNPNIGSLTVRETLIYSALLRLPASMQYEHKMQRVEEVLNELGLNKIADNPIGTQFSRGISGGERKRVAIGVELITAPSLLFLDERILDDRLLQGSHRISNTISSFEDNFVATSGLDGTNSLSVMATLSQLAKKDRTIVCTIHQYAIFMILKSNLFVGHGLLYSSCVTK